MRNTVFPQANRKESGQAFDRHILWRALAALVIGLTLFGSEGWNAFAAPPPDVKPAFPDIKLPNRMRGEEALDQIGSKLPEMAAYYKTTPGDLRQRMQRDKSLWVDKEGRLFYVCDWGIPPATNSEAPPITKLAVVPYQDTFKLHSRPGASKILYLDFDGHDASGTAWGSDAIGKPYDTDGNPSNFSNSERDVIQYIWQRVAEDYALFDIDVTTEEPGTEALRRTTSGDTGYGVRCVIGGSSYDWYGAGAGGVSYVGTFDEINASGQSRPNWVWPAQLGNTSDKNIAEAVSHECGHALGLSHDGRISPAEGYYAGQGNWAPIMGVGYYEPITQWSKGEYASANQTQDDLVVMQSNGVVYRTDDHGNSIGSATALNGVSFSAIGNIEQATDVDFFSFTAGAGRTIITATPAPRGANLHILLSLYDSGGNLITSTNAADTTAGVQPVTLSVVLPIGNYYFSIDGIGVGDPVTTGYSDYASLGQYTISGTVPGDSTWLPTAASTYSWTNTANWLSATIPLGADAIARVNNNIVGDQLINLDMPITLGRLYLGDSAASHVFGIQSGLSGSLIFASTNNVAFISKTTGLNDKIIAPVVLQSDLTVTNTTASDLNFAGVISGARSLTKMGSGRASLSAANTYSGSTVVGGGSLALDTTGSVAATTNINVRAGSILDATLPAGLPLGSLQTLGGSGSIVGDVTVATGATLTPGSNLIAGTLTFSNNLTLNAGAKLRLDLANTTDVGGGTNDLIAVNGNLTLSGTVSVDFSFLNSFPASPGTYTIITYTGSLLGGAVNLSAVNAGNSYTYAFDDTTPGEIRVQVNGAPNSLVWQGDNVLNRWDIQTSSNWLNGASPSQYSQLDTVLFTDPGSVSPAVSLLGTLTPNGVTVNSSTNYSFTGAGKISGSTSVTKQGTGVLTISTANDYSGATLVNAGTLKAGNASALGNVTNGTTVAAGATLDLNAMNLGAEVVTAQGTGATGNGAILSSSPSVQSNALRFVTLSGNATFGGSGRWDVRPNPTATFTGNNFNLNKTNANEIWMVDLGNTGLGDINVNQGVLAFQGSTTMGDVTKSLNLATNTSVNIYSSDYNTLSKKLVMNNSGFNSLAGDNTFSGSIALNGSNALTASDIFTLSGSIVGPGKFTKLGTGILMLNASNNYDGQTLISAGTVTVRNSWAFGNTNGDTVVASGARLDINGINLGAESVVVSGTGLGNAGAIVNNGGVQLNAFRFVSLAANSTFGGISRWDIRANPTGSLNATNSALTKIGQNEVWLVALGSNNLGAVTVSEGMLGLAGTTGFSNAASSITVNSGATLALSNLSASLPRPLTMSSARLFAGSGNAALTGNISLSGSNSFDIPSGTLTLGGVISGSGTLACNSAGTVQLTNNNTYSGMTIVNAGVLQIGTGGGTGSPGTGTITNNTTMTFNRTNTLTVSALIVGTGALNQNGSGVLTLGGTNAYSGATTINAGAIAVATESAVGIGNLIFNAPGATTAGFRSANATPHTNSNNIIISGNQVLFGASGTGGLTFNGPGVNCNAASRTLIVSNTTTTISSPISNEPGALVKDGPGTLVLSGANNYIGGTIISLGALRIDDESRLGSSPAAPFKSAHFTLSGGTLETTATFSIDDPNRGVTLGNLGGTFNVNPATTLTIANAIAGAGNLTKIGTGTLTLTAASSYSSNTFVSAGTLALAGAGSIASSPIIQVDGGTVLDVSGVSGTYTLANFQTLRGNGTIIGNTIANGTVAPGTSIGKLTFNNSLTLAGVATMETSKSGSALTNDVIAVGGTLTYGGALNVVHTGNTLTNGDSFKLFNAPVYAGAFNSKSLPSLNPGLRWNTSLLASNGTIQVATLTQPQILPVALVGTNLMISLQSDSGVTYELQTTAGVEPPVTWMSIATNTGTGEVLTFPTPVDSNQLKQFFRVIAY